MLLSPGVSHRSGAVVAYKVAKDISVGALAGGAVDAPSALVTTRTRLFASIFPAGCSPVGCPAAAFPLQGEALGSLSHSCSLDCQENLVRQNAPAYSAGACLSMMGPREQI